MYLDANNSYRLAMSQKLPANDFKWVKKLSKFDKRFIKNYDENSNKGYEVVLEVDLEHAKKLLSRATLKGVALNLHMDLPFLPERNKTKKCNKLVCNMYDKENYVVHIRALKQALNHGLIFKKYAE